MNLLSILESDFEDYGDTPPPPGSQLRIEQNSGKRKCDSPLIQKPSFSSTVLKKHSARMQYKKWC